MCWYGRSALGWGYTSDSEQANFMEQQGYSERQWKRQQGNFAKWRQFQQRILKRSWPKCCSWQKSKTAMASGNGAQDITKGFRFKTVTQKSHIEDSFQNFWVSERIYSYNLEKKAILCSFMPNCY
ncbi:hypothetical protein NPIL_35111 [Nephila pilipes]|uniref:Uncharacterized protein n=1 Tax=Nephila pilipes TaxID=299642 RepID=A0A8X6UVE8_NEPPI|nr:hypothetical protein NPIL_35111 [Nephila pilipes]